MALSFTSTESEDPDEGTVGPRMPRLPAVPARGLLALVIVVTALILAAAGWYIVTGETPLAVLKRLTTSPSFTMALPPPPGAAKPAAAPARNAPAEAKPRGEGTAGAMLSPPPEKAEAIPPAPPPAPAKGVMPAAPAEAPAAPPPPASGAVPSGPSPVKPIPLQKAAEVPPPAPPPSPAASTAAPAAETNAAQPMSQAAAPSVAEAAAPAMSTAMSAAAPVSATAAPPQQVAAAAPPPPPMNEPLAPPAGEPLAPPSFAQLPARTDLKPLPPGPVPDLLKDSPDGPLPVADGGKEPRAVYARPFVPGKEKQAKIAVVVVGLGVSREAAEAAIAKLPPEIDLSFSPYAGNLDAWVKKARAAGHEVLLDLPLEPPNFPLHDAGPLAILTRDGPNAAVDRLHQTLGKTTAYVGVAAALHSPVAAGEQWAPVLRDLKSRGLLLLGDPLTGAAADAPAAAPVVLVPDETPFRAAIDAGLARLLATAQRDGSAVAYVSPRPVTFERLLAWSVTLPQKGAVLAPASALVQTQP